MTNQDHHLSFTFNPKLDAGLIVDFFGSDTDHLENVFTDFLNELPAFKQGLDEAYVAADIKKMKAIIHRFKPLYQYVGLPKAYVQLEFFEQQCVDGVMTENVDLQYKSALAHLQESLQIVEPELARLKIFNVNRNEN